MRLKLALTIGSALIAAPAIAHPQHGFELPDLFHIVSEPDHLAIAAGVVILAFIGRFALKHLRK